MSKQLHKNFVDEQVKLLLKSYVDKEIKINYILSILGIKRRRFFKLLARYKKDPDNFSIQYNRKTINRKIDQVFNYNLIEALFYRYNYGIYYGFEVADTLFRNRKNINWPNGIGIRISGPIL